MGIVAVLGLGTSNKLTYNLKSRIDCKAPNIAVSSDPYMALVM